MSYRNPKAAPINDDSAIYEGIQKLSSDVVTFANNERDRKAALIAQGLAASQAVDDNVNKMGLNIKEGGKSNFQTQVFEKSKDIKNQINGQFAIMSKTFSSPEDRAKAKAEIARLQKYPEQLVGEMATGKYIVDQLSESMQIKAGTTGSVSFSNDINLMGVGMDLKNGGKNTTIEDENGGRVLVTTNEEGETFRLNISAITQSLASNPDQSLFKTVQDDTAEIDMYSTALGFGKDVTKETLIANNHLIETGTEMIAGVKTVTYGVNMGALEKAAKDLSLDLLENNSNYNYTNSIWQDRLGNKTTLSEARDEFGNDKIQDDIQDHYIKEALKKAQLNLGFTLKQAPPPKPEKVTKATKAEIEQKKYNELVGRFKGDAKKGGFFDKFTEAANKHLHGDYTKKKKDEDLRELLSERGLSILPIYDTKNELIEDVQMIKDKNTGKSIEISADRISKKELMDAVLVMQGIELPDIQDITRDPLAPIK
jgi:hypothetical protein